MNEKNCQIVELHPVPGHNIRSLYEPVACQTRTNPYTYHFPTVAYPITLFLIRLHFFTYSITPDRLLHYTYSTTLASLHSPLTLLDSVTYFITTVAYSTALVTSLHPLTYSTTLVAYFITLDYLLDCNCYLLHYIPSLLDYT